MTDEAPMRRTRRGLRLWLLSLPVALPAVGFVCLNLWLASPPGRGWIAAKVQRRTGLEARIGNASLTPWGGVRLHDLELLQAADFRDSMQQPLARIASVRLTPVWASWLHGKRELRAAELDSPRMVIPIEWLAAIAKAHAAPVTAGPPLATTTPAPPTPAAPATPGSPATPGKPPGSAPPTTPSTPKAPAVTLPPTAWLRMKDASLSLVSATSGKPWLELSGLSGAIPVAGSPAQSALTIDSIRPAGNEPVTNLKATLDWQPPLLSLKPLDADIHGLKLTLAAKLAMLGGLPLQVEAQLPRQKPSPLTLPHDGQAEAETIAANARFRGLILAPGTWQGDLLAEAVSPSARIGTYDAKFDRGQAVTVLRGGILSCLDARLIGDDFSLLGNATLLADGRAAAALRMVAPPDNLESIVSRLFPAIPKPHALTPLATPQRAAFDLRASGNLGKIVLQAGHDGPLVEITR